MLRKEFDNFRVEIREMYQADMVEIRENICDLSSRVDQLEKLLERSQGSGTSELAGEEIIAELEERQKRSLYLIFFNLEEVEESASSLMRLLLRTLLAKLSRVMHWI